MRRALGLTLIGAPFAAYLMVGMIAFGPVVAVGGFLGAVVIAAAIITGVWLVV